MVYFLLDANVIYDFLADRKPHSREAAFLFSAADRGKIKLYVSAISYNNLYYVLRKDVGHKKALDLVSLLDTLVTTIDVGTPVIRKALKSKFKDFEDAIQYYSALTENKIQAIVTRNSKDFKSNELLILDPARAIRFVSGK